MTIFDCFITIIVGCLDTQQLVVGSRLLKNPFIEVYGAIAPRKV
ncbi:hypothetical protein [Nostoc sp. UHCC 0251]|nr:hypothetical protein [Nostoc sp. UHCC 0251]MEA5624452.1 hypothetical protein [Nostoc sp. UHCC 0251]